MIMDSSLLLDPQGTALTTSRPSTNVIDLVNPRDIGIWSRPVQLIIQATSAWAAPAGTSINVQWQGSVDSATWLTMVESGVYPFTTVPPGRRFLALAVPRQFPNPDDIPAQLFRYLRANYVIAGGPLTAGTIAAFLALDANDRVSYPKNFSINS